jgi:hypothetical protein
MTLALMVLLAAFGVWMYGLADVIQAPDLGRRGFWTPIVFFGFAPGAVAWLVLGRPQTTAVFVGDHESIAAAYPETSAEFRERVRARAESQRSGTNR